MINWKEVNPGAVAGMVISLAFLVLAVSSYLPFTFDDFLRFVVRGAFSYFHVL